MGTSWSYTMPLTSFWGAGAGACPGAPVNPVDPVPEDPVDPAPAMLAGPVAAALAMEPIPTIDNRDKDNFFNADLLSSVCMLKF